MEVQTLNFARSETVVYTPAVPSLTIGPLIVASRADLVPSTDPLAANNVEFGRGLQPPSSDFSTTVQQNPTSTGANTSGPSEVINPVTKGTQLYAPIVDTWEPSIVTKNADGTVTLDENSTTTTAADLSRYTTGAASSTVSSNGTIAVATNAAPTTSSTSAATNAIDVKA